MDRERYQQIRAIFLAALEVPEHERAAFVLSRSEGDEQIRIKVEALLSQQTRGALHQPAPSTLGDYVPQHIGPYRITEVIAVGGMGTVYRAEQSNPIRREVAIKLIRGGLASENAVARFHNERQVLASLNHPHIAQVYDGGSTENGLPYFAMELVDGEPITDYCRRKQMDIQQRVDLFADVCRAVQHAHNKGVIHRDLKPSNIMVTEIQGRHVPKIIDFGIAKALDVSDDYVTMATREGQLIGTLEYMSPEQASGGSIAVDTRSDVYALGVVLYQLISERLPYELDGLSAIEAVKVLVHGTPTRITFATTCTGARHDLEIIVMKALEKEPDRRYESALGLAVDLGHFLRGEPISARAPSTLYQLKRLVMRHKLVFGFGASLILVLAAFGIGMSILYSRQQVAKNAALQQAEIAQEIGNYLGLMLRSVDPVRDGRDVTVARMLENVSGNVDDEVSSSDARVAVRSAIGQGFFALERYEAAATQMQAALDILEKKGGTPPEAQFDIMDTMVAIRYYQSDFARAIETCQEIVRLRSQHSPESPGLPVTLNNLGRLLVFDWRFDEAIETIEQSVALHERNGNTGTSDHLVAFDGLSYCCIEAGEFERALPLLQESGRLRSVHLGEDNEWTMSNRASEAEVLRQLGRLAEADSICDVYSKRFSERNMPQDELLRRKALTLLDLGRENDAVDVMQTAMKMREDRVGQGSPRMYWFTLELAYILLEAGRLEEALAASNAAVEQGSQSPRRDHPNAALTLSIHGACLTANARHSEAEAILREAIAVFDRYHVDQHWSAVLARFRLAECLAVANRWDEARTILQDVHSTMQRLPYAVRMRCLERAATLYERHHDRESARVYRDELDRMLTASR